MCPQCGATDLIKIERQQSFDKIPKCSEVTSEKEGQVAPIVDRGNDTVVTAALPAGWCLIQSRASDIVIPRDLGDVTATDTALSPEGLSDPCHGHRCTEVIAGDARNVEPDGDVSMAWLDHDRTGQTTCFHPLLRVSFL